MASSEIKIDDDYVNAMAKLFNEWSTDLQAGVDSYISILDAILEDAIMEGKTANKLKSFATYAASLSKIIESLGTEAQGLCVNYLLEIDDADSYLY